MNRYARIDTHMPREFVLLQGTGCRWGKCTFCDYHEDRSDNPFPLNRTVLNQVTGCHGVLDVINSGSAPELDEQTLELIAEIVSQKQIHTLWFEAHYMYRNRLQEFAARFPQCQVKFRCGVESFNPALRSSWNKGIPPQTMPEDIARYFQGICLLCCTQGQTREDILQDIATARRLFEYFSINIFCNNSTPVKRDEELVRWFSQEIYPTLCQEPNIEILIENTDLGIG